MDLRDKLGKIVKCAGLWAAPCGKFPEGMYKCGVLYRLFGFVNTWLCRNQESNCTLLKSHEKPLALIQASKPDYPCNHKEHK